MQSPCHVFYPKTQISGAKCFEGNISYILHGQGNQAMRLVYLTGYIILELQNTFCQSTNKI